MFIRTCTPGFNASDRRIIQRCRQGIGATMLAYFGLNGILMHWRPSGSLGEVVAGLAGAMFFLMFVLFGLIVARSRDEFGRALMMRSLLGGLIGTMFFVFVWGFVEMFSHTPVAHIPILFVPVLLALLTAGAKVLIFRRHTVSRDEPAA